MNVRQPLPEQVLKEEIQYLESFKWTLSKPEEALGLLEDKITQTTVWVAVATMGDEKERRRLENLLPKFVLLNTFYTTVLLRYLQKTQGIPKDIQHLTDFDVEDQLYRNQVDYYLERAFGINR
jgi:hypothetical protein